MELARLGGASKAGGPWEGCTACAQGLSKHRLCPQKEGALLPYLCSPSPASSCCICVGGMSFSNSHKGARRTRHPAGGAGEERGRGGRGVWGRGGIIPAFEARATMATVDTARSTAMTARAQRRDLMYMGSPAGGEGTTRRHRLGDGPNSGPC